MRVTGLAKSNRFRDGLVHNLGRIDSVNLLLFRVFQEWIGRGGIDVRSFIFGELL